ncbi:MAG: 50S ribosomal protein L11 methyltransferase [Planctomycetota bacterium]|jgi:methylase of polypeptide subunit release factors
MTTRKLILLTLLGTLAVCGAWCIYSGIPPFGRFGSEEPSAEEPRREPLRTLSGAEVARPDDPGLVEAELEDWVASGAPRIREWGEVEDFPKEIAVFETVFWEPRDTASLRAWIRNESAVKGKTVLEIGTGSGLLSLCCLAAGAEKVVATDVNRSAILNAQFNARQLGLSDRLELRLVPLRTPRAFAVFEDSETFDLIISNPPWEDAQPFGIDEYAYYDLDFELAYSLLEGLRRHLNPGGRALLAYGCVSAVRTVQKIAPEYGLEVRVLDDRDLDDLPEVFLPGMLLEVMPQWPEMRRSETSTE